MNHRVCCYFLTTLLVILGVTTTQAQVLDTTEYSRELSTYHTEKTLEFPHTTMLREDTNFLNDYKLDPYRINETYFLDLGPVGTPALSFSQRFEHSQVFDLGYHTLDAYQSNPQSTKYYHSNTPRTLLKYSQGSRDMLYLKAEHSQKISDLWVFGLDYERVKSNNIYFTNLNSLTNLKIPNSYNTKLYSYFHSPNKRYHVLFNAYWDKNTLTETGGISDRSHFDTLQGRAKQYFNFANVVDASNTIKRNGVYIKQYYRLGNYPAPVITYDSINTDSVVNVEVKTDSMPMGTISHQFEYVKDHQLFEDNNVNLDYFTDRLLSATTLDSVEHHAITNTLSLDLIWPIRPVVALQHSYHSINQNGLMKWSFHDVNLRGSVKVINLKRFGLSADLVQHFTGYNAGDRHIKLSLISKWVGLDLLSSQYQPDYVSNYFVSNNFYWFNNFEKIQKQEARLSVGIGEGFSIDVRQYLLGNWVYYDANARPVQHADQLSVTNIKLKHWLKVGRWNLRSQIEYNDADQQVLPMPKFAIKESFYYERALFKKTMPTQIGFDVYYQNAFDGLTYNPAIRQFHLSPGNSIGDYPMIDFFFNAKVGGFKMFGVIQHVTEELFGNAYYSSANYPMVPFSFRFGLEWRLFD